MNMQNLMAQAQKMQKEITSKKAEIDKMEFVGKSQWIDVVLYGNKTIKSVKILDCACMEDKETLEDMLKIAFDNAINQIEKELENKMGMYSGMNGLF